MHVVPVFMPSVTELFVTSDFSYAQARHFMHKMSYFILPIFYHSSNHAGDAAHLGLGTDCCPRPVDVDTHMFFVR